MVRHGRRLALIAHGGAGARALPADRPARRQALEAAVARGAAILERRGSALDAVVAVVTALEDDPLFNAGYGSVLNTEGRVEMDAAVMTAEPEAGAQPATNGFTELGAAAVVPPSILLDGMRVRSGGVVMVSRVRNPILLARAVMERTPHVLFGGAGAERIAQTLGIKLCRTADLVSPRARERWLELGRMRVAPEVRHHLDPFGSPPAAQAQDSSDQHGTVGAVAVDVDGRLAAATSTGGVYGKMPGRIGDSAMIGAGLFASSLGAASATGAGEAILQSGLCRTAVEALARGRATTAASRVITTLGRASGAQAGVIIVGRDGQLGFAHNAAAMDIAIFRSREGVHYCVVAPLHPVTLRSRLRAARK